MPIHIFVPRWMNRTNTNAQSLNARAMLSRFRDPRAQWTAMGNEEPPEEVSRNGIRTITLSKSRQWKLDLALAYQTRWDAIFYPGWHWPDELGIKVRRLCKRHVPLIATIEGVIAEPQDLHRISHVAGHSVFAQPGTEPVIPRTRWMYATADHIIAISPFLCRIAKQLYGDKVSYLPLGVERSIFHSLGRQEPGRCRVASCGTVKHSKNPQLFLKLAERYKEAQFVWFGDGPMRAALIAESKRLGLDNLSFPGALQPESLAEEFRRSSIFVLSSYAEGVPKVSQEAAACGLPVVLFGFYETPSVIHERNGLVSWSDDEMSAHVGRLIRDLDLCKQMGYQGAQMAKAWDWDMIAPQWEELVIRLAMRKA